MASDKIFKKGTSKRVPTGPRVKTADKRHKAKPATARKPAPQPDIGPGRDGERIAKVMARAGLCSRRDAETWILAGRVEVNGKTLDTPAVNVGERDQVVVDGEPLPMRERTRLWLYHKPRGLVSTNKDPEGRPTVFDKLPKDLPRVLTVGRLDINTEGLLLLTNDGGLSRVLELPTTGWLRRYRVRAFGQVTQEQLDALADGVAIEGVLYGAIEASLDKIQGDNVWLTVGLREGKNREVKRVLEHLGLSVNRLIRISFGPFQLLDLDDGDVREIRGRVLRDQLGEKLAEEAGCDFDAPILNAAPEKPAQPEKKAQRPGGRGQPKKRDGAGKGHWLTSKEGREGTRPKGGGKAGFKDRKPARFSGPREDSAPKRPARRIWGEDGLIEDKRQGQDQPMRGNDDRSRPSDTKPRGRRG
ncbi:rRNA pseudouridine synthase [Roseibium sp. RKSG952]|nr:rRNA pseudouridine synthase [Roseibium sp. RKSG952]